MIPGGINSVGGGYDCLFLPLYGLLLTGKSRIFRKNVVITTVGKASMMRSSSSSSSSAYAHHCMQVVFIICVSSYPLLGSN